jgi:hypothetical protein
VKEAYSVYKVSIEYLLKRTVSFNEFYCSHGINLNDPLLFSIVQSTIKYLRGRDVIMDDVKCFNQICNLIFLCKVFRILKI